jgi:hypothetical protein
MRLIVCFLTMVIVTGCGGLAPTTTPVAACNPTRPNGDSPAGEQAAPTYYGNGRLYTTGLWPNGEIRADPRSVAADGSIGLKFAWWRAPGVGAAGDLQIVGHELSTNASIVASIPDGYGQHFQATGITFPTDGCYEITARSGDTALTFVVKVVKVSAPHLAPSPPPSPPRSQPPGGNRSSRTS